MKNQFKRKKEFIKSAGFNIYVEFIYPKKVPAPAVIIAHGLRSYYPGLLDRVALKLVRNGYIAVKFHYVGTGYSDGKLENKLNKVMFQNLKDVLDHVSGQKEVTSLGFIGRSNSANLILAHGPDQRIGCYVLYGPNHREFEDLQIFIKNGEVRNGYVYHKSFKRPHTKGPGRIPIEFFKENFEPTIQRNIGNIKRVLFVQGGKDETMSEPQQNFDYFKTHLPQPQRCVLVPGTTHSYLGKKQIVYDETVKWIIKYLPL